jgi:hypothetical protein
MGAIGFLSLGILFLLSLPLITSRLAKRLGRDPKRWFLIGLLLPGIATVVLFCLEDLSGSGDDPV